MSSEWQPIETVPEGKELLFFEPAREVFEDYSIGPWYCVGTYQRNGYPKFSPIGISGYELTCEMVNPTHWMELPEDPI